MTIKVLGRLSSANVQKVVWTLAELGVAYDHTAVGGKYGGNDTPEYLAMNPNGLVPTLRDGDLTLWESHAIVRYLAASYGEGRLFPADPRARAIIDQWMDWVATTFQPAWLGVFALVVRTPVEKHDKAAIAKAVAVANRCFGMLDARLAETPFVSGAELGYADIAAGVSLYRWTTMGIDAQRFSHVEAWHARLSEREAFRNSVNVDYEELRVRL